MMLISSLFNQVLYKAWPSVHLRAALHLTCAQNSRKAFNLKHAYGLSPIFNDDKVNEYKEQGLEDEIKYAKIRFARAWETGSVFYDENYESYIRHIMRGGRRGLMYKLLHDYCYEYKTRQFNRLRKRREKEASGKAQDEEEILLDPVAALEKALVNCKPQVITRKVKRGGATYHVPFPISDKESYWYSKQWMDKTLKERAKPRKKKYAEVLADEVLAACKNQGKVIKIRDDVHRLAQANKAYAHYRWG